MAGLQVRIDWQADDVQALVRRLNNRRLLQALSVAVNQTARQVRRKAVQEIMRQSELKRTIVDPSVTIRPFATPASLLAVVKASGKAIPLKQFDPKEIRSGVVYRLGGKRVYKEGWFMRAGWFGRTKKSMGRNAYAHGRTRKAGQGDEIAAGHVFSRSPVNPRKIKKETIPGVSQSMASDAVMSAVKAHAQERLAANVRRQLDRYVAGRGGANR